MVELEDLLCELDSPSNENSKYKITEKGEITGNCNDLLLADLLSDNLSDEDKFMPSQILAQLSASKSITAQKPSCKYFCVMLINWLSTVN